MTGADKIVMAKAEADAPVVLLLHSFLADPNVAGWDGLAVTLASKGFHVLRFDFRGHGKSTVISKAFWDATLYPDNTAVFRTLSRKKPLPLKLENADLKNDKGYQPVLVNDLMAARIALDKMNDAGKLNTASVYLIGAGDAATLGMMYAAAEWTRPQKPTEAQAKFIRLLPLTGVEPRESAGKDIAGAVWLSPARPTGVTERTMQDWVKTCPDMRESNPVLCLYGEQDSAGKKVSESIRDDVLVAKPKPPSKLNPVPLTQAQAIAKSKLVGIELLKDPATEKVILDYLTALEKDRKSVTKVVNRNYNEVPYVAPSLLGVKVK
jgi:pimeloyl-ACP methyl ester carboxylesterase